MIFKSVLVLVTLLISLSFSLDPREEFSKFKLDHAKIYANIEEEEIRFHHFSNNLKKIDKHTTLRDTAGRWESQSLLIFQSILWKRIDNFKHQDLNIGNINLSLREEFVSTYASGLRGPAVMSWITLSSEDLRTDIRLEDLPSSSSVNRQEAAWGH